MGIAEEVLVLPWCEESWPPSVLLVVGADDGGGGGGVVGWEMVGDRGL